MHTYVHCYVNVKVGEQISEITLICLIEVQTLILLMYYVLQAGWSGRYQGILHIPSQSRGRLKDAHCYIWLFL